MPSCARVTSAWSWGPGTSTPWEALSSPAAELPLGHLLWSAMADPPPGVQRDYPLARLTTIRTGGPAALFARPGTLPELERVLAWAREEGLQVGVVGSGSNL